MTKQEPPRNKKIYARSIQQRVQTLMPPPPDPEVVWTHAEALLLENAAEPKAAETPAPRKRGAARRRKRLARKVRRLDITASAFWAIVIANVFVADFNRDIVDALWPQESWLLNFQWLFLFGLAALLLLMFKKRTLGLGLAYVGFYPLVLVFWKVPKLLIKRRSPVLAVGVAGLVTSVMSRARRIMCAIAIMSLCATIVFTVTTPWLVALAMTAMAGTLVWWIIVTAIDLLKSTSFLAAQENLIKKILNWDALEKLVTPKRPDRPTLKDWSAEDAKGYVDTAGNALLAYRLLHFWAYALDQYRRGPSVVILNAFAVVGLFLQVIVAFSFINYGAFVIDPYQFHFTVAPTWWTFAYYSACGNFFSEIAVLSPVGTLAIIIKFLNGIIGSLVVLTVCASIFINYRSARADAASVSAIQMLRSKADDLEELSDQQYALSLQDLEERLKALNWGLRGATAWLASRIPMGWDGQSPAASLP